jgi:acetyl-CoA C-acetyltransferase
MATLSPVRPDGLITAAVSSQVSDGAAALVLASGEAVRRYGLQPLARIRATTVVGSDPVFMLTGPIPATQRALSRAGLATGDIDVYEINEAFACVPLAWEKELGIDPDRVNVHGGAIALGHPLGATGARLMTTLIHELRRSGRRVGLQTICEGGGQANATILELV